jgi:hypothetical protein
MSRALVPLMAASALGVAPGIALADDDAVTPATTATSAETAAPAAPAPAPASEPTADAAPPATAAPGPVGSPDPSAAPLTPDATPITRGPDRAELPNTVVVGGTTPQQRPGRSGADPAPTPGTQATDASLVAPGLLTLAGVGSATIRDFDIPPFLLPIYQAAGSAYGIPWPVLASINRIETDFGRNLNISSAGAIGWMQFMPATWATYGTDANDDGIRDPYNPADAIFAAARYLKAAGGAEDLRRAIFAYNHADWYVNDVLEGAARIAALPAPVVDALTGLTGGIFPVDAPPPAVAYDGEVDLGAQARHARSSKAAAPTRAAGSDRRSATIRTAPGARLVAVQDGTVEAVGATPRLGRFIRVRDSYGNRYTYAHLGQVQERVPVLRARGGSERAHETERTATPEPTATPGPTTTPGPTATPQPAGAPGASDAPSSGVTADEARRLAYESAAGTTIEQAEAQDAPAAGAAGRAAIDLDDYFSIDYAIDPADLELRRLAPGRSIVAGTVLGYAAQDPQRRPVTFELRPAGGTALRIDPTPFLNGWRLADATDFFAARARTALGDGEASSQVGRILLMNKQELSRRVLGDRRISIYDAGRADIRAGLIDRRILALLAVLAERDVRPTVSSLLSGHGRLTASGNVSEHSTGDAVDIATVYGTRIMAATQGAGSVTDRAVREILRLQGTMRPHQIITLHAYDGYDNTLALADHDDHIHVGFRPDGAAMPAVSTGTGGMSAAQWKDLVARLATIKPPTVRSAPPARDRAVATTPER